jgi:DNA-binding response OmpR family regulator
MHIMFVDDDPHLSLAIRACLKRYGFKVAIKKSGPRRAGQERSRRCAPNAMAPKYR